MPDNVVDFLLQTTIHTVSVTSNEEKQRRKLTIEEVVGHLNSIIGGGFGTTNAALAFVLHQLTVNEDIQEKVFEEIQCQCGLFVSMLVFCRKAHVLFTLFLFVCT